MSITNFDDLFKKETQYFILTNSNQNFLKLQKFENVKSSYLDFSNNKAISYFLADLKNRILSGTVCYADILLYADNTDIQKNGMIDLWKKIKNMNKELEVSLSINTTFDCYLFGSEFLNAFSDTEKQEDIDNFNDNYFGLIEENKNICDLSFQDIDININMIIKYSEQKKEEIKEKEVKVAKSRIDKLNISNILQTLRYNIDNKIYPISVDTGIQLFNNVLGGGFFQGVYVIGGEAGVGKTSFLCQIIDNIVFNTDKKVLYLSFEMPSIQLTNRNLSRLSFNYCFNQFKSTNKITVNTNDDNIKDTVIMDKIISDSKLNNEFKKILSDNAFHFSQVLESPQSLPLNKKQRELRDILYNSYFDKTENKIFIDEIPTGKGISYITTLIDDFIKNDTKIDIVVLDYFQLMRDDTGTKSVMREYLDLAMSQIKTVSKKYNLIFLVVSSFNRDSYSAKLSLKSFKETGGIEYSADCVIGIGYKDDNTNIRNNDNKKKENKQPRELILKVLKNRYADINKELYIRYFSRYNKFFLSENELKSSNTNTNTDNRNKKNIDDDKNLSPSDIGY